MKAILEDGKSIFLQISESIEDDILTNTLDEESLIPSTNQFAKHYSINPATAAKGINILVDAGIIYKKRGIGMYVATGARKKILDMRKQNFYENFISSLIKEATKLDITKSELIQMIEKGDIDDN